MCVDFHQVADPAAGLSEGALVGPENAMPPQLVVV
jgi:hypothetical protein